MRRRAVRVFGAITLMVMIGTIGWLWWRSEGATTGEGAGGALEPGRSLAAVLVPAADGSASIVVADLDAMRVVRRVGLRSLASEMALDATSGLIVTAQCGDVGAGADDAAGIVDVRSGAVSYVTLDRPNPESVVAMGGRAFVMHGWTDQGRPGTFRLSVVDPVSGTLERSGEVPETLALWRGGAGRLWTTERIGQGDDWRVLTVSPADLTTRPVGYDGRSITSVVDGGTALYLLSTDLPATEPTSGSLVELDPVTLAARRTVVLSGLRYGAIRGAVASDHVAVIDDLGEGTPSAAVTLVERSHPDRLRTVEVEGAPAALAAWGDRFVVVDRAGGRLLVIDPAKGAVTGSIDLGTRDLMWTDVEVLPVPPGVSVL